MSLPVEAGWRSTIPASWRSCSTAVGTLGPEDGKRSRGELVLDALDYADAADAARAMVHLDPAAYRPFNLVVADNRDAFWLTLREGAKRIVAESIPEVCRW